MTLTICRDEKVAEQYLMLPELGRVLQKLRSALPGMCVFPRTASMNVFVIVVITECMLLGNDIAPPSQLLFQVLVTSQQMFWNLVLQTCL